MRDRTHRLAILAILIWCIPATAVSESLTQTTAADKKLNEAYQAVTKALPREMVPELIVAQRTWIKYRDNVCAFEAKLAEHDRGWIGERTSPDLDLECIHRITVTRTRELEQYLKKISTQPRASSSVAVSPDGCSFVNLPETFEQYAIGRYSGYKELDIQLGRSGNTTKQMDVVVNKIGVPIVLVLAAYDPVVWHVGYVPGAEIVGVIVSGYHTQALTGLPNSIPRIISTNEEKTGCGYIYVSEGSLKGNSSMVEKMTGKAVKHLTAAHRGGVFYVDPNTPLNLHDVIYSNDVSIRDYIDPNQPPVSKKGLDLLASQGKIRLATAEDINAWVEEASKRYKRFNSELRVRHYMIPGMTYVILERIDLPDGLYGGHSRSFIIPKGVPSPGGPAGHNQLYYMDGGKCTLAGRMQCPQ